MVSESVFKKEIGIFKPTFASCMYETWLLTTVDAVGRHCLQRISSVLTVGNRAMLRLQRKKSTKHLRPLSSRLRQAHVLVLLFG
jgi:hypothetical protein